MRKGKQALSRQSHAKRMGSPSVLLMSCAIQHLICNSTGRSKQPQMLCVLGCCCMSMGISPHSTFTTSTVSGSKLRQSASCNCSQPLLWLIFALTLVGSRLTPLLSASSQLTVPVACSKSCRQTVQLSTPCYPPWTGSCQLKLSKLVRGLQRASLLRSYTQPSRPQLAARSQAQMACRMSSSLSSGICLALSCLRSCKTPSKRSMRPACQPP